MAKKLQLSKFEDAFGKEVRVGDRVGYIYVVYGHKTRLVSGVVEKIERLYRGDDDYTEPYKWNINIHPDDPHQGYSRNVRPSILHFTDKIVFLERLM